jgi:phosphoribosylanthranilate isomerase
MTSAHDVALAVAAGADAIGIIVSASPRRVAPDVLESILAAVPPFVTPVIVSAGETAVHLRAFAERGVLLQFSGLESPADCERIAGGARYLKAFHVRAGDGSPTFESAAIDAYPHAIALFDSSAFVVRGADDAREGAFFGGTASGGTAFGAGGATALGSDEVGEIDLSRIERVYGGTGLVFDWSLVAGIARERPIVVSGGLNPGNVGACVRALRPYAVDVRSGIETDGRKDTAKMRAFVRAVRDADLTRDEPPLVTLKGGPASGPASSGPGSTGSTSTG